ncbi:MAG: ATP-grasp domain-containing protein [Ardenticatenaceae bacterium]|nr:ATP-grasp domain-containing protein [Ardenticatenaceae bacterium]MCB8986886.1 ATP-grasp domain-containing protein [Ardenticatenaceae bacterium]
MFKRILIANRGEIATRIILTCREMGLHTIALYEAPDEGSRHVRMADECALLDAPLGFLDQEAILRIARETGAEAIHPGYGYLAEEPEFVAACEAAGIVFVGPGTAVLQTLRNKIETLARARAAGFPVVDYAPVAFDERELKVLEIAADLVGYPLVVKSCSGGRGSAERLVRTPQFLETAVHRAQQEAQAVYGNQRVYLEKAILPAHQIGVQILADKQGHIIHLGEREGSLQYSNRKVVEEAPAPCLTDDLRQQIWQAALDIARLFQYENAGTVEFLLDNDGNFYFTEIKSRIQVDHALTEMMTRINLVEEQLRIAAGEPLRHTQADVRLDGWAMLCRIHAEDPWRRLPSPGRLRRVRLPGGPEVRVDTYVYSECDVPDKYDPLIAKLTVWGADRARCLARARRAVEDLQLVGTPTNLPLLLHVLCAPEFADGRYDTSLLDAEFKCQPQHDTYYRDLAVIAAMLYVRRNQMFRPSVPVRALNAWHQDSRRLPE